MKKGFPYLRGKKPQDAQVFENAPKSGFWDHPITYGELDAEINQLQKRMDTFSFPNPGQDWKKFCECFPGAGDESELRALLKVMYL